MKMIIKLSKGQQITIPADIREDLGLDVGSRLEMIKQKDSILLKPVGKELQEMFKEAEKIKPKHKFTPRQMKELNWGIKK